MNEVADSNSGDITDLLASAADGDAQAGDKVMRLLYASLRQQAVRHLRREYHPQSLSPTELVHEAYLELFPAKSGCWNDRHHFFAYASRAMRNILIDGARRRLADKRGGAQQAVAEEQTFVLASDDFAPALLGMDQALEAIEKVNPRAAQVVELRFFAGLPNEDVAQMLGVTARTALSDWKLARALIHAHLKEADLDELLP